MPVSIPSLRAASVLALLAMPLAMPALARTVPEIDATWLNASSGLLDEAREGFRHDESREGRLGRALVLLLSPTRSEANYDRVEKMLRKLAEEETADESGVLALYYLARLVHVHRPEPDLAEAVIRYRRVTEAAPDHPFAGQAWVKMAIIELYEPGLTEPERLRRWLVYADRREKLVPRAARRDMAVLLAQAGQRYRFGPDRVLEFYLKAEAEGIERSTMRADVYLNIANLARDAGRVPLCLEYYDRFLAEFRRDRRRQMVVEMRSEVAANVTVIPGGGR